MSVTTVHPQYSSFVELWRRSRDAITGQPAIKAGGTKYLPASFALDESGGYSQVYQDFKERAYFLDLTGRTQAALVGMVFRKDPEIELPPRLQAITENMDGQGQSLEQLSKELVENTLAAGRHILLADYPEAQEGMDAETEARLGLQPTIASYPAESLINWKVEGVKGRQALTLAVLQEMKRKDSADEFSHDTEKVYRVLRLRDGVYTQQVYDDSGNSVTDEYAPRMAGGAPFDHIPLHIAGASNNKPEVDIPPLLGLADVNISHYQTTANIEEAGWNLGQPMLSLDVGESESDEFYRLNGGTPENPPKFRFGSRFAFVSKKGKAEIVQSSDSDYNVKLADRKEQQAVMIGARIVQRGGQAETAEASRINASAEASVLEVLVGNCSEAMEAALEDCARFLGENPDLVELKLNTTFWESTLDPQSLQVVIAGWQSGLYDQATGLEMVRSGQIKLPYNTTVDEIIEASANQLVNDIPE